MLPLTVDDLLPLEEYVPRRREFFDCHRRYLDRCRRVRLGQRLTLVFENRQTLWFRVQEVLRIARLTDPAELQHELNLYNRLLPGPNLLQAALLIELQDERNLLEELAPFRDLDGSHLSLSVGKQRFASDLVTCRPEDRATGTAHWVQFRLGDADRLLLADSSLPARFIFDNGVEKHHSAPLTAEQRQSLLADFDIPEKIAA